MNTQRYYMWLTGLFTVILNCFKFPSSLVLYMLHQSTNDTVFSDIKDSSLVLVIILSIS